MDTPEPFNWLILDLLVPFGALLGWLIWYDHTLRRAHRIAPGRTSHIDSEQTPPNSP